MNIGLLALQGAVSEHKIIMRQLDINTIEVREREDIEKLDGLIMPGGESTTLRKLLKNSGMWDTIKDSELPIMGTCAGAILLGKCEDETFEKMDIEIDRNYYGRQKDSFEAKISMEPIGISSFHGVFIRAPSVSETGSGVEVLAKFNEKIVAVKQGNVIATAFHPELTKDTSLHKSFVKLVDNQS